MWNRKGRRIAVYVFKTLHSPCIFLISAKFSSVFNFTSLNKNKANLISKGGETLARGGGAVVLLYRCSLGQVSPYMLTVCVSMAIAILNITGTRGSLQTVK